MTSIRRFALVGVALSVLLVTPGLALAQTPPKVFRVGYLAAAGRTP